MSGYENILFDLDGTVTESAPGIFHSIRYAMDRMGYRLPDDLDMNVFIGPPLNVSFRNVLGFSEADADRALSLYREYYGDRGLLECRVYPGVPELLARLCAEGRTVALATAKPETFSRRIKFPLKGIAPGEYVIKMSLISGTPRGRSNYYDTIVDVSRFVITDDPAVNSGFIWSERLWGNERLEPLEME